MYYHSDLVNINEFYEIFTLEIHMLGRKVDNCECLRHKAVLIYRHFLKVATLVQVGNNFAPALNLERSLMNSNARIFMARNHAATRVISDMMQVRIWLTTRFGYSWLNR